MGVKIFKDTKVFVACPANAATGGPELLHQLVDALRNKLGVDAYLYYYRYFKLLNRTPVHPAYQSYNLPYVLSIKKEEDNEKNILIVSEVLSGLSLLPKFKNIRKGVWFLGVDAYYYSRVKNPFFLFKKAINKILMKMNCLPFFSLENEKFFKKLTIKYNYKNDPLLALSDFYVVNSFRGLKWFSQLKPIYYIPDYYVSPQFYEYANKVDWSKKENMVVYNPKKDFFTKKLIKIAKDITFVPLINMTREKVINTLLRAKVYVDFGNFPGPERIPKEAVLMGCCVITSRRGCANFYEDVPIPEEYKIEAIDKNFSKIISKIKECFLNYELRFKDFEEFRKRVILAPQRFIEDLKKIFQKI